jgi:penicillin-binding protein 1C
MGNFPFIFSENGTTLLRLKVELKWCRRILRLIGAFGLLGIFGWFALPFAVPLPATLKETATASPVLLDRHGEPILYLTLPDSTRSSPLRADEIPADIIASTLAAEDKRFYRHCGIDPLATLRAARDFLVKRRVVSGASTITQQLVKITSPHATRSPATKIREALAARRLEMTWSKHQILTAYLNHLDYGNLRIGAVEAARFYFQKPLPTSHSANVPCSRGFPNPLPA